MRINLYISSSGYCSRREADRLIQAGKVTINGTLASIGSDVRPEDHVAIAGERITHHPEWVYILYNKPQGIITTTDRMIESNIIDAIQYPERIFPVGRLDRDSSGLIMLTNNGAIVNRILRHENRHEKEYLVTLAKPIDDIALRQMAEGVEIYNPKHHAYEKTEPCTIERIGPKKIKVILTQGLNLQIRRMARALGNRVEALMRVRLMNFTLGSLKSGEWRHLNQKEVELLPQLLTRTREL
ncbi:MAG: pseudouridine synthase [Candidatus Izemoplasmatales bacterium]|jgi:23S rRNA pseudouridine2604 synthase